MARPPKKKILKENSFAWIKKNLAPDKSTIIFEQTMTQRQSSDFTDNTAAFDYLASEGLSAEVFQDPGIHKEYLVILVDAGDEENVLGRLLGYGFPGDAVYYLYRREE